MPYGLDPPMPLASRILDNLKERFDAYGHHPTPAHWEGLAAVAGFIEAMAEGRAPRVFAYSALPTGLGKSSTVAEALRILTSDPQYADVGVIVFLSTYDQIRDMIEACELRPGQFAVQVGKAGDDLNRLGVCEGLRKREWPAARRTAQVLFTTQQKLLHLPPQMKNSPSIFQFQGKRRAVRIWDEAIIPAQPVTFSGRDVFRFAGVLDAQGQGKAADMLRGWWRGEVGEGVRTVPRILDVMEWQGKEDAQALDEVLEADELGPYMLALQGCPVRVVQDAQKGATVVAYCDYLPREFAPLLILDASGHLRLVYELWRKGRGGMRELPSPGKTYANLLIRHWDHPAGKVAYRDVDTLAKIADGVIEAVRSLPPDDPSPVLVIHHGADAVYRHGQGRGKVDLRALIEARASPEERERLRFLTWGRHMASNAFADVRHVIVAGLLQYSLTENEALQRAALGLGAGRGVSVEDVQKVRLGEVRHHVFQGVGRGAVRKMVAGDVPEGCTLTMIFSAHRSGTMPVPRSLLSDVFPGARVEDWSPFGAKAKRKNASKHRAEMIAAIERGMMDRQSVTFELTDLMPPELDAQERKRRVQMYHLQAKGGELAAKLEEMGFRLDVRTETRQREGVTGRGSKGPVTLLTVTREPPTTIS